MGSVRFDLPDEDHSIAKKLAAIDNSNLSNWFIKAIKTYIELRKRQIKKGEDFLNEGN